jgi:hypothetical protein
MLDAEGFEIPIPTREIYSSVPWRAEKLSDYHPASHLTADSFLSRWRSGRGVKFVTDLPLVPRSRITGSVPTLPLYALMARTRKKYIYLFSDVFDLVGYWAALIESYRRFGTDCLFHIQEKNIRILIGLLETIHQLVLIRIPSTWYVSSIRFVVIDVLCNRWLLKLTIIVR